MNQKIGRRLKQIILKNVQVVARLLSKKYATLYQKIIATGDPNCPEEVNLTKRIKYLIGNKAAIGDTEEEFDLEEVEFGENGANPNPGPADTPWFCPQPTVPKEPVM